MKGWDSNALERLQQRGMVIKNGIDYDYTEKGNLKRPKYNNQKTVIGDVEFDSVKEAKRFMQLSHWQHIGAISNLELQVPYELNTGGTHSLKYVADFVYTDNVINEVIVEDTKGMVTTLFKKKKRLMKKLYNIDVKIS